MLRIRIAPLLAAAVLLAGGCASRRPPPAVAACERAWSHVDGLLHAGLERYVADMAAYVTLASEGRTTAAAQARTRQAAADWSAANEERYLARCRAEGPSHAACVAAADAPAALAGCGLAPLLQSFSDEVLPVFSADPMDRLGGRER